MEQKERITEIGEVTINMLGTESKRKLALKAAESKHFFHFLADTLDQSNIRRKLRSGEQWASCNACLRRFMEILDQQPLRFANDAIQERSTVCACGPACFQHLTGQSNNLKLVHMVA